VIKNGDGAAHMIGMTDVEFEKQHPRQDGGQFARKDDHLPDGEVTLRAVPSLYEAINESYPVPQANSLETVSAAVSAVAADVNTVSAVAQALDLDARQGSYYLNAAAYLGLVEVERDGENGAGIWHLTALGQEMTYLADAERAQLVAELAESTPAVAAYREGGMEGAENAIAELGEYGDDTVARRAACASSWANTIASGEFAAGEARITSIARDRFEVAAAAARVEREQIIAARTPKAPDVCPECFTEIPASGVCGSFACA